MALHDGGHDVHHVGEKVPDDVEEREEGEGAQLFDPTLLIG